MLHVQREEIMCLRPPRVCTVKTQFTSAMLLSLQQVVADRVLLARLVLLREELRMRAEQQAAELFWAQAQASEASNGEQMQHTSQTTSSLQQEAPDKFFGYHRSNLPVRCATFLKELLSVPERDRRLGLLSKVWQLCTVYVDQYTQ